MTNTGEDFHYSKSLVANSAPGRVLTITTASFLLLMFAAEDRESLLSDTIIAFCACITVPTSFYLFIKFLIAKTITPSDARNSEIN